MTFHLHRLRTDLADKLPIYVDAASGFWRLGRDGPGGIDGVHFHIQGVQLPVGEDDFPRLSQLEHRLAGFLVHLNCTNVKNLEGEAMGPRGHWVG